MRREQGLHLTDVAWRACMACACMQGDDKPLEVPNIPLTEDMKAKAESVSAEKRGVRRDGCWVGARGSIALPCTCNCVMCAPGTSLKPAVQLQDHGCGQAKQRGRKLASSTQSVRWPHTLPARQVT